jgi:PAS domain S-box-containing protein
MNTTSNLLNAVIEGTGDVVYVKDLEGRFILINTAGAQLLGHTPDEIRGQNPARFLPLETAERIMALDQEVVASAQKQTTDELLPSAAGTRIFETVTAPYRDDDNRIIGVVGISRDVTAQRRQAELNRFRAEAGNLLASSIDYETRLTSVAKLAVSEIADWCVVHMVADNGAIEQLALAHRDPSKVAWARELQQRYPPRYDSPRGLAQVLRSGKPELVPEITEEMLAHAGVNAEQLELIRMAGLKSYMIVPLIARGRTLGAITFVSTDRGRRFDANDLTVAENLASRAAIYIDNARLYREMQQLNESLEQRVAERTADLAAANRKLRDEITERQRAEEIAHALFRISNKLNSTRDLNTILDELSLEATALINAESGFAGLRTPQGMSMRTYFSQGQEVAFEHTWSPGQGMPGWVMLHKESYITNDAAHDPVMRHELPINSGVRTAICTPILDTQGEVLGYFDIRNKKDGKVFTADDRQVLLTLAPVASIAMQNALAYQKQARAEAEIKASYKQVRALAAKLQSVREEERTHIARELHDGLGQALTALKFDLAWLVGRLAKMDGVLRDKAQSITAQIDETIKMVRRLSSELRLGMLDDFGLAASIEAHAQEFQERTGIQCDVSGVNPEPALTRAQATALFRIFQETMTNVARHAQATQINIRLSAADGVICLQVHDNGRGLQPEALAESHSLGVVGMRERAELLDGTLEISSAPGAGTTVTVSIPLNRAESESRS